MEGARYGECERMGNKESERHRWRDIQRVRGTEGERHRGCKI